MPIQFPHATPGDGGQHSDSRSSQPRPTVPYSQTRGQHADLRSEGVFPYCAMMQVAAADTYTDYVICRGFDIRRRKFVDYESGNADKPGISVAKPFGSRYASLYTIGEVYPAVLPTQMSDGYVPPSPTDVDWRVGQNPGTAPDAGDGGHPQDLDDSIEQLTDHNNLVINWLLLGAPASYTLIGGCLGQNHPGRGTVFDLHLGTWSSEDNEWSYADDTVDAIDWRYGVPYPDEGATGLFTPRASDTYGTIYECVSLDCESPGACGS